MKQSLIFLTILFGITAALVFLRPRAITVSVVPVGADDGMLSRLKYAAAQALGGLSAMTVSDDGVPVRVSAAKDGAVYQVLVNSDLLDSAMLFRVPATDVPLAEDIIGARIRSQFPWRARAWRHRLDELDELIDIKAQVRTGTHLERALYRLTQLRSSGVAAAAAETELARYLYELTGFEDYLETARSAYAAALRIAPEDVRVLTAGVRLARAQSQQERADQLLSRLGAVAPGSAVLAWLHGDYQLAGLRGHQYASYAEVLPLLDSKGKKSWDLVSRLRPGPQTSDLVGRWHLLYGDPAAGLAVYRDLRTRCVRGSAMWSYYHAWEACGLHLTGRYFDALGAYFALKNSDYDTWIGECWYGYATSADTEEQRRQRIKKAKAKIEVAANNGSAIAKAWLGDREVLGQLPDHPAGRAQLWLSWRVKTLLGERALYEREQLDRLGVTRAWFERR
jgi:hypothetical protein